MCVSPLRIKNPNYGLSDKGLGFLKDCDSAYINVPCGHCIECVCLKQSSWVQRVQMESLYGYPFFCTLTYNNESLPRIEVNDHVIRYADYHDFKNMVKRLKNTNAFGRSFRYLAVSEFGSEKARPHFHALFFLQKLPDDTVYTPMNLEKIGYDAILSEWRRNYGSKKKPDYRPLCTFKQYILSGKVHGTYDFHFVVPSSQDGTTGDVSFYITKYLFKPSDKVSKLQSALKLNLHPIDYEKIWKIVKPRCFASLNFGYGIYDYQARKCSKFSRLVSIKDSDSFKVLRSAIDRSLDKPSPQFFDVETGKPMPLSRYYQNNGLLFNVFDKAIFQCNNFNVGADNVVISKDRHISELLQSESKLVKVRSSINDKYKFQDLVIDYGN